MDTRTVGNRPRRVGRFCGSVHFPDPKVGVGVLAGRDDELLLVRRAVAPEIGRWSVPGGLLDAGEDPRAAAARETLEEANLVVDVGDLVDVYANPSAGDATVFLLYRADAVGGELRARDDAADARFFGRTGLPGRARTRSRHRPMGWRRRRRGRRRSPRGWPPPASPGQPPPAGPRRRPEGHPAPTSGRSPAPRLVGPTAARRRGRRAPRRRPWGRG